MPRKRLRETTWQHRMYLLWSYLMTLFTKIIKHIMQYSYKHFEAHCHLKSNSQAWVLLNFLPQHPPGFLWDMAWNGIQSALPPDASYSHAPESFFLFPTESRWVGWAPSQWASWAGVAHPQRFCDWFLVLWICTYAGAMGKVTNCTLHFSVQL